MMYQRSCRWLAVILFFQMGFNISCSTDPVRSEDPRDAYYSISCILLSSSTLHNVVIGKAWPEELPAKVPDARVFIQGDGERISFSYAGVMGTDENTGHPLQVQPAIDTCLEVQILNERDFLGHIVTPGAIGFLNIAERDTRTKKQKIYGSGDLFFQKMTIYLALDEMNRYFYVEAQMNQGA